MFAAMCGLFGLVVGSFLNVVILRHGTKSIGGRSACPHCNTQLRWPDLIPVISWLALRGRCRSCHARISVQYPLVEAATAASFAVVGGTMLPLLPLLASLAAVSLLICICVYDLKHKLIPDVWVWPFILLALVIPFSLSHFEQPLDIILLLLGGPLAALPLFALWAYSRGAWMGFGDVKLALGIGWLLGFPIGIEAIFFSFVIGAVISVGILLPLPRLLTLCGIQAGERAGGYTMKSEVPFGPFLIASCLVCWIALLYGIPLSFFPLY